MNENILELDNINGRGIGFKLKNVRLDVPAGYITGLMGKNGSGKTTLIRYIMDKKCRYRGNVFFEGKNVKGDYSGFLKKTGFISEDRKFFEERSAYDNGLMLGYLNDRFDREVYEARMNEFQVPKYRFYQNLSRGEKIKWQLALAISFHPTLYIMDEPTAGMDAVFRKQFYDVLSGLISAQGASVLITSHIEEDMVKRADYVAIMDSGRILRYGEAAEVLGETEERTANL